MNVARPAYLIAFVAVLGIAAALPDKRVEEHARDAAASAAEAFRRSPPNDGATLSARAYASGRAVVYEYVLSVRQNVTDAELEPWRAEVRKGVVRPACSLLKADPMFDKGFHFIYRYLDRSNRLLGEFRADKAECSR